MNTLYFGNDYRRLGSELVERDGEEAPVSLVHREELPFVITGGVAVDRSKKKTPVIRFFKNGKPKKTRMAVIPIVDYEVLPYKQTAVFEDDEPSRVQQLTDKIAASGKSVDDMVVFFREAAHKMLTVLGLPNGYFRFAIAFLRDTLDPHVDWRGADETDRWKWQLRYPRLTRLAKTSHKDFCEFQEALAQYVAVPDLTKPQPKPCRRAA